MGLFDAIKNSFINGLNEMNAREQYVNSMSRGLDVMPASHKLKCSGVMAVRKLPALLFTTALLGGMLWLRMAYADYIYGFNKGLWIFVTVVIGIYETGNLNLFLRSFFGLYKLYGGYVLDKKYDIWMSESARRAQRHRSISEQNKDSHTIYFVNVNGVMCRVSKSAHLFLKLDRYYYVLHIKRFISAEEYFFIAADESAANSRTGNYFPDR